MLWRVVICSENDNLNDFKIHNNLYLSIASPASLQLY